MKTEKKEDCCAVKDPRFGTLEKGFLARNKKREFGLIIEDADIIQRFAHALAERLQPAKVAFAQILPSESVAKTTFSVEYLEKNGVHRVQYEGKMTDWQYRKLFADADIVLANGSHFPQIERQYDVAEGVAMVAFDIQANLSTPSVKGLILAGGRSTRMGSDKGLLNYYGKSQREFAADMLQEKGIETYISCRADQMDTLNGYKGIADAFVDMGPVGGILSAFLFDPNAAWLVVACDLPLLTPEILDLLLKNRRPSAIATAFQSLESPFPEPLIALWEPKAYPEILQFLSQGAMCPRKVLINADTHVLSLSDLLPNTSVESDNFFLNANTPEERDAVKKGF